MKTYHTADRVMLSLMPRWILGLSETVKIRLYRRRTEKRVKVTAEA